MELTKDDAFWGQPTSPFYVCPGLSCFRNETSHFQETPSVLGKLNLVMVCEKAFETRKVSEVYGIVHATVSQCYHHLGWQ